MAAPVAENRCDFVQGAAALGVEREPRPDRLAGVDDGRMIAPKEITDERIGGARNLPHEIHRELARIRDTLAARVATYLRWREMGRLPDGAHDILEQRHFSLDIRSVKAAPVFHLIFDPSQPPPRSLFSIPLPDLGEGRVRAPLIPYFECTLPPVRSKVSASCVPNRARKCLRGIRSRSGALAHGSAPRFVWRCWSGSYENQRKGAALCIVRTANGVSD